MCNFSVDETLTLTVRWESQQRHHGQEASLKSLIKMLITARTVTLGF